MTHSYTILASVVVNKGPSALPKFRVSKTSKIIFKQYWLEATAKFKNMFDSGIIH